MQTCAACGRDNADDARFCSGCAAPLREELAREERKIVTVLFADLVGFTSRAETLDPEDVRDLLSPYYARLRSELERYGGTVEKFIGDAVMALFGAPVAHEDDPERAVRAALEIRDWIAEEGKLQVRIAVNTGEALVSLGARPSEGEGMAAGDVVNTTARLQAAAPVNGVLVGETTYRATAQAILYEEAEPVVAKGKKDPLRVWRAVEPRSTLGVDLGRQLDRPLVGRAHELEVLLEALARARRERSPQLVTLVGVPGIGKSRLVRELFDRVDADPELIFWRQGRCLPYGDGVSFWALAEMVKAHAGILESDAAEAAERKLADAVATAAADDAEWVLAQLRPLVGLTTAGERGDRREESFSAWRHFLEALAEQSPLVLVFEDLHWADEGLLDFVDAFVDRAGGVPLLVLCTARPELLARRSGWGGGKANALTLSLSPLSRDDTARLLGSLLEQTVLPEELQTQLLNHAEGNPLYAEEFVRMLQDRGDLRRDGGTWRLDQVGDLPLPETVQGLIAARLDALTEREKALIGDAATVGKVFWSGALASGSDARWEVEETLHTLERKALVHRERRSTVAGETEYAFDHALVRDVAYGMIPRRARAEKHLRLAGWIEALAADRREDHAEMLAQHYLAALELQPGADDDVVTAARATFGEAGDRARSLGAYRTAARYYGAALELWPMGEGRGSLLLRHGEALFMTEQAGGGTDRLLEAREALLTEGLPGLAAEAELMVAEGALDAGDGIRGGEHLLRAIELVERGADDRSKAFVLGWGAWRLQGPEGSRRDELSEEAVRVARALDSPELESVALNGLGISLSASGQFARSFASFEEAVQTARAYSPFQTIRSLGNFASVLQGYGDARRARGLLEEAYELAVEAGVGFATRWLETELTLDRYLAGEWERARPELDAYLAASVSEPYFMDAPAAGDRALIRLADGDFDGAIEDCEWALQRAREAVEDQIVCPALATAARCLQETGRTSQAAAAVEELAVIVSRGVNTLPHAWFVQLAFALRALDRAPELEALADRLGYETPWTRAAVLIARGELGPAADVLADIGSVADEAWARLQSGEPVQVERALAFYRSVGATHYAALAESRLSRSRSA